MNRKSFFEKLKEVIVLLAAVGMVLLFLSVTHIGCPIKWVTGVSCPGCGMTRALWSAVRFRFGEAFRFHPLVWMVPLFFPLYLFWERIPGKVRKGVLWVIILAFLLTYLIRLCSGGDPVVGIRPYEGVIGRMFQKICDNHGGRL